MPGIRDDCGGTRPVNSVPANDRHHFLSNANQPDVSIPESVVRIVVGDCISDGNGGCQRSRQYGSDCCSPGAQLTDIIEENQDIEEDSCCGDCKGENSEVKSVHSTDHDDGKADSCCGGGDDELSLCNSAPESDCCAGGGCCDDQADTEVDSCCGGEKNEDTDCCKPKPANVDSCCGSATCTTEQPPIPVKQVENTGSGCCAGKESKSECSKASQVKVSDADKKGCCSADSKSTGM